MPQQHRHYPAVSHSLRKRRVHREDWQRGVGWYLPAELRHLHRRHERRQRPGHPGGFGTGSPRDGLDRITGPPVDQQRPPDIRRRRRRLRRADFNHIVGTGCR